MCNVRETRDVDVEVDADVSLETDLAPFLAFLQCDNERVRVDGYPAVWRG